MEEKQISDRVFIWDDCNSKEVDKYILGGTNVKLKTSGELLITNRKRTSEIIDVGFGKTIIYFSATLIPFIINGYSIITRWLNRPERDPYEFHNWSKLSLIHVEFAGLSVILANFFSNSLYLITCLLMDCIYNAEKPSVNEKLLKRLSGQICFFIALPLFVFSIWNVSVIIYEECGFFFRHIENINNNITNTNSTFIYGDNTKFGNLDYIPFLTLGIIMFLRKLCRNIENYNRYSKYIKENIKKQKIQCRIYEEKVQNQIILNDPEDYTSPFADGPCYDFTLYDPRAIKGINYNIQSIGKFSLLKVIVWTKHQLPQIIKKTVFLINSHTESENKNRDKDYEKQKKDFNESCWICIYFSYCITFIFMIPFIISVFMLFAFIFGISFLSLVIKVGQVSFVGELEILDWKYDNYVQFIAFLNNILSLDTGKVQSFDSIMTFMFSGEDAKEDKDEKIARKRFINGLINYSVSYQGLLKTLIILPQIGTDQLQNIFIHGKKENSDNESSDNEKSDNESSDNELSDNEKLDNEKTDNESSDNEKSDNESSDNENNEILFPSTELP